MDFDDDLPELERDFYGNSIWPFKVLHTPKHGQMARYFFVDERWKHGPDGSNLFTYWWVHNGTVSVDNLHRTIARHRQKNEQFHRKRPLGFQVFQAKNRTQVVEYLRERSEPTSFMNSIHPHPLIEEESTMPRLTAHQGSALPGRSAFLERRIAMMQDELDLLQSLPAEPKGTEDGTNVIWWEARFPNGTNTYTYAATKAGDGLWYTTGPRSPKGFSWGELIEWMAREARPIDGWFWTASEFEAEALP